MRGKFALATVIVAAVFVARQPSVADEAVAVDWQAEALAERAGTWNVTTTYTDEFMAGLDPDHAVATRSVVDGPVLLEQVSGTMLQMPYTEETRFGYDPTTGRYWAELSDPLMVAPVTLEGDYEPATATYTYLGTVTDPQMGDITMRIAWTVEGPDRETVVHSAELADLGMLELMRVVYERAE